LKKFMRDQVVKSNYNVYDGAVGPDVSVQIAFGNKDVCVGGISNEEVYYDGSYDDGSFHDQTWCVNVTLTSERNGEDEEIEYRATGSYNESDVEIDDDGSGQQSNWMRHRGNGEMIAVARKVEVEGVSTTQFDGDFTFVLPTPDGDDDDDIKDATIDFEFHGFDSRDEFLLNITEFKIESDEFYFLHQHTFFGRSRVGGFEFNTSADIKYDDETVIDATLELFRDKGPDGPGHDLLVRLFEKPYNEWGDTRVANVWCDLSLDWTSRETFRHGYQLDLAAMGIFNDHEYLTTDMEFTWWSKEWNNFERFVFSVRNNWFRLNGDDFGIDGAVVNFGHGVDPGKSFIAARLGDGNPYIAGTADFRGFDSLMDMSATVVMLSDVSADAGKLDSYNLVDYDRVWSPASNLYVTTIELASPAHVVGLEFAGRRYGAAIVGVQAYTASGSEFSIGEFGDDAGTDDGMKRIPLPPFSLNSLTKSEKVTSVRVFSASGSNDAQEGDSLHLIVAGPGLSEDFSEDLVAGSITTETTSSMKVTYPTGRATKLNHYAVRAELSDACFFTGNDGLFGSVATKLEASMPFYIDGKFGGATAMAVRDATFLVDEGSGVGPCSTRRLAFDERKVYHAKMKSLAYYEDHNTVVAWLETDDETTRPVWAGMDYAQVRGYDDWFTSSYMLVEDEGSSVSEVDLAGSLLDNWVVRQAFGLVEMR